MRTKRLSVPSVVNSLNFTLGSTENCSSTTVCDALRCACTLRISVDGKLTLYATSQLTLNSMSSYHPPFGYGRQDPNVLHGVSSANPERGSTLAQTRRWFSSARVDPLRAE